MEDQVLSALGTAVIAAETLSQRANISVTGRAEDTCYKQIRVCLKLLPLQ